MWPKTWHNWQYSQLTTQNNRATIQNAHYRQDFLASATTFKMLTRKGKTYTKCGQKTGQQQDFTDNYFTDHIHPPCWRTSARHCAAVPRTTRTFNVSAPRIWNALPEDVVSAPWLSTFWRRLKTFLFQQSYLDRVIWLYIWHHSGPWSDFSYLGHSRNYWTELNWVGPKAIMLQTPKRECKTTQKSTAHRLSVYLCRKVYMTLDPWPLNPWPSRPSQSIAQL